MSALLFPVLPGLEAEQLRSYRWKTGAQESLSNKRSVISYATYPRIHYDFSFEFLRDDPVIAASEIKAIVGLHNAMKGHLDTFLYNDPELNSATATQFAVADGTAGPFQLTALYTPASGPYAGVGSSEIVQNLNGTPVLQDNASTISAANYSIGVTGLVTFGAGHFPASGHLLSWTGNFYTRCSFDEDEIDWKKFMNRFWEAKDVAFTSVIL